MQLDWMGWTEPTAIFFVAVFFMLVGMTVWEIVSPNVERKGFLPMPTTRGDRLFISLLACAYILLGWLALTSVSLWWAVVICVIEVPVVMRWG